MEFNFESPQAGPEQNQAEQLRTFQEKMKFERERLATPKFEKITKPWSEQERRIEREFPKIETPEDIELVKKLQNKFKEYRGRIRNEIEQNPNRPAELLSDTQYKALILEKLLTEGEVNSDMRLEFGTKFGGFLDMTELQKAWRVIEDYTKTGGKGIKGGTGLK